jgi:hypothetical protein
MKCSSKRDSVKYVSKRIEQCLEETSRTAEGESDLVLRGHYTGINGRDIILFFTEDGKRMAEAFCVDHSTKHVKFRVEVTRNYKPGIKLMHSLAYR